MKFVFQFIRDEKPLFVLNLIFIFLGTFFLISQIFLISNLTSFTFNIDKARLLVQDEIAPSSGLWNTIENLYQVYRAEGNLGLTKYVVMQRDVSIIVILASLSLLFTIISQGVLFLKDFVSNYFTRKIGSRIRMHFFDEMVFLPISFFRKKQTGDIISRATNDVKDIESEINTFLEYGVFGVFFILVATGILLYLNLKFTLILFLIIPIIILIINFTAKVFKKLTTNIQEKLSDITNKYHFLTYGIDIIKIFTTENYERKKFSKEIFSYLKSVKKQIFLEKISRPINEIFIIICIITIVSYGSSLIWHGEITIENLLTFILVLIYISQYIQRLNYAVFFALTRISVSSNRLTSLLKEVKKEKLDYSPLNLSKKIVTSQIKKIKGGIEFKNVFFSYPDQAHLLKNISFSVKPGELVALVGDSGQGKSTLLNLIPFLLYPDKGEIFFDGVSSNEISLLQIRKSIAIVTQENILFASSIKENIRYGSELDISLEEKNDLVAHKLQEKKIKAAAKAAYIDSFIKTLPDGYDTLIGERGTKLSGGQKQRICIARAIYNQPSILLLDEATSSLDSNSEKKIQESLEKNFFGKVTTFIISHRLSTIKNADKILLLKNGSIVESGKHQQLIKKKGQYYKLFKNQLNEKK